jgi:hypothetical protein
LSDFTTYGRDDLQEVLDALHALDLGRETFGLALP